MTAKDNKIANLHNTILILIAPFFDVVQYIQLDEGLLVEFLFISDHFKSGKLFALMIKYLKDLSKRSFS